VERRVCTPELASADAGRDTTDVVRRLEGVIERKSAVVPGRALGALLI